MEALKDDEVSMIRLYGMEGCGKTILTMDVRNKVEADHIFYEVMIVSVSSTVEVGKIQEKIATHRISENENKTLECALENDVTLQHNSMRYLCCEKVPNELDYSNLELLYLYTNLDVSDGTFEGMRDAAQRYWRLCNDWITIIDAIAESCSFCIPVYSSIRTAQWAVGYEH
ncbi:hypothetical protein VNO78_12275 [Psophocarpus tetragonolobus]|uniref:NB-ARC domain-containing protein n=1 Tax=Psophocarpus tetragonolobus TaxID=3891 RepID=A0AAN9SNN6_PSOTE